MSNGKGRTLAFEMKMRENFEKVLQAINDMRQDLSQKFDKLKAEIRKPESENTNVFTECRKEQVKFNKEFVGITDSLKLKCKAVRQGLAKNRQELKRAKSQLAEENADILSINAMLSEINERVLLLIEKKKRRSQN